MLETLTIVSVANYVIITLLLVPRSKCTGVKLCLQKIIIVSILLLRTPMVSVTVSHFLGRMNAILKR